MIYYVILFISSIVLRAEEPSRNTDFVLGFFPEYDSTKCLVMYQFDIPDNLLPYNIEINIPETVGHIFELDSTNNLNKIALNQSGILKFNINKNKFFFQFYLDLKFIGSERSLLYNLRTNKELTDFYIFVQKPVNSNNFKTSLLNAETFNDEYNITYHRKVYPILKPQQNFSIDFKYEKKSDITSVKALESIFKDDNHGNNENEFRHKNQIEKKSILDHFNRSRYFSFLFGFPIILFCSFLYIILNRKKIKLNDNDKNIIFCSNCGAKYDVRKKFNFCKKCGSKL